MDYKKMYLEQKRQSLVLEMNMMNMRADAINKELPAIEAELKEYESTEEDK